MKLPIAFYCGELGERLKPAVLKTVVPERVPGVRIPRSPPFCLHSRPHLSNPVQALTVNY